MLALSAACPAWSEPAATNAVAAAPASAEPAARLLKFSEFFVQPIGERGLVPTAALLAAQGQQVRIRGWMVSQEEGAADYFLLTARPVRLSEHADGDADDLPPATLLVRWPPTLAATPKRHQPGLIEVVGTLVVGRTVEPDGRVSWVQLQLSPPPPPPATVGQRSPA
ncbi:MAG: hypothetical protein CFE46_18790 [Burkholderiales bacterium PBB6]|nr:MAG: hypothetical protein CFE46_18790 [Burkholderiales bacterium PBB6]